MKELVQTEVEYIDSAKLAKMIGYSKKFIEKHRHHIVGAVRIGRQWRFPVNEIRLLLSTGRDIIVKQSLR